ncbi:MAG TPA: TonB-dependent receptor, partial [Sphingobium sp.]|nr:TonB-dependent receptor [Sphingobium sp.]
SIGFVDARFRRDVGAPRADGAGSIVAAGDRVPYVPRWSGTLSAQYGFPLARGMQAFVRSEWQYSGRYRRAPSVRSVAYDPRIYRGQANDMAMLRIGISRDGWDLTAFIENMFDDHAILYRNVELAPATGSPVREAAQRPRTIGLSGRIAL